MPNNIEVNQKSALGSETTQIAMQNIYNGLPPAEACKLATELFYENFPKLQECAANIVNQRIDELMERIAKQLQEDNVSNMAPFADPDVQYALFEAQKNYARFGAEERLSTLSTLISKRVQHSNSNFPLQVAIDKAIEIAGFLTDSHLDYLSLLFLCTRTRRSSIKSVDQLENYLVERATIFSNADVKTFMFLNMLGCLQFSLSDIPELLGKTYGFEREAVEAVCPDIISKLSGDYSTSHIGTILAIVHIEAKLHEKLDPAIWIYE